MSSFFEPNIHPVFVHFAYALMTAGAVSLLIVTLAPASPRRESLKIAGDWMIAFGAAAIFATVAAGFQAYYSVAHDGPSHEVMTTHRNWAVPTAIVLLGLSFWRWRRRRDHPSAVFALAFFAAAMSLSVTAWWGGRLVYGHGIGVARLPAAEGAGHDHDHGGDHDHGDAQDGGRALEGDGPATGGTHEHDEADHDHGADDHDADHEAAAPAEGAYPETPESVVEAFAAALRAGNEQNVRRLFMPDAIIAESGGAERSLEDYAGHHLPADMAFTAAVETTLKDRHVIAGQTMATVISESQIHGAYKGKTVHSRMMETMVLRREGERWRIAHIHWSSAPITGEHEH